MHGMVEVTLVQGGEESLEDRALNVVACQLFDFTTTDQTKHAWLLAS